MYNMKKKHLHSPSRSDVYSLETQVTKVNSYRLRPNRPTAKCSACGFTHNAALYDYRSHAGNIGHGSYQCGQGLEVFF